MGASGSGLTAGGISPATFFSASLASMSAVSFYLAILSNSYRSISEAAKFRGNEVRIPLASRPALPAGEFYQSDLIGCEVIERSSGLRLGRVRNWQHHGGPGLLQIEGENGEEILVPFASSICVEIDPDARRIVVDLPEGLKELNR